MPLLLALMACTGRANFHGPPTGSGDESGTPGDDETGVPDGGGADPDAGNVDPDAGTETDGGPPEPAQRNLSTDRALFFGTSRCANSGLQLCEDFEAATLNTATWTSQGTGISIGTDEHARGTRALHISRTGNGASFIGETKTFPATNNTYYGRMFVKFVAMPQTPLTYSHWTLVAATGTGVAGEIRLGGQLTQGKLLFGVGTDNRTETAGTGDWTQSDRDPNNMPRPAPLNEWLCLEWMHKGQSNETRFWWDSVEHPSLYTSSSIHGGNDNPFILPQFTRVKLGWDEYQATTLPFELWIDEVGIDPNRIGCVL